MAQYRLLTVGRYRFGHTTVVDVTPEMLVTMAADTPVPLPIVVRHDATKVTGQVTRLFVTDDGNELWAVVHPLWLVPSFSVDPPLIQEVSVTGHRMIFPEPLPPPVLGA